MSTKDKNKKTICTENNAASIIPIPAKIVAGIVGGSTSMVKQVRQGKKDKGKMCREIQMTDELLTVAVNASVERVTEFIQGQSK